jgi:hypothetical protein
MKFLTAEEAKRWCQVRGLDVDDRWRLFYSSGGTHAFSIRIEEKATDTVLLSDYLVPSWEDVPFEGTLLWITDHGIWGENSEKTGLTMIKQMRSGNGEQASLGEKPAHLFAPNEVYEAHSYLLLPIFFGWDALLVPETGDYFVSISHHGVAQVVCRDAGTYEQLSKRLKDWSPTDDEKSPQLV